MRAIKFRAWHTYKKQLCEVAAINLVEASISVWVRIGSTRRTCDFDLGDSELMQFTGLVDKNGKEIYEGDIVREGGHNAEVVFDIEFARFGYKTQTGRAGLYMFAGEVIGNIYENPELVTTGGR